MPLLNLGECPQNEFAHAHSGDAPLCVARKGYIGGNITSPHERRNTTERLYRYRAENN